MTREASVVRCGKLGFRVAELDSAIDHVIRVAQTNKERGQHVHFANAYSVALAEQQSELVEAFEDGICFPDGRPVVWALKAFHSGSASEVNQVRGPSFFEGLMKAGVCLGLRHFFLGSTDETLSKLQEQLTLKVPGLAVAGASSPPFRDLTDEEWSQEVAKIEASGADIVWVGLGTPKQDLVAYRLSEKSSLTFICVGAAFDFSAGNLRHAPMWMQNAGLEWFYRLLQEPRRLWRRYLIGNTKFIAIVCSQFVELIASRMTGRGTGAGS